MGILDRFRLDGKLALVTGSATGLGAAIALALAEAGASVACHGNRRPADDTSETIRSLGRASHSFAADLGKPDGADSLYEAMFAAMGAPDVLVNNAGTIYREPAEDHDLQAWMTVVQVNLNSVFRLSQLAGRSMLGRRQGKIINIASVAGLRGSSPKFSAIGYSASKGGVIIFTKDLACKWGMHNIQVNAIAPGWFPTDMSEKVIERNKESLLAGIPLGRFGGPQDLKGAAIFLASSASDFVTGQILAVDGGQSA